MNDDLISRRAVLDFRSKVCAHVECENCPFGDDIYCMYAKFIVQLPPVTPKQRTGRWIKEDVLTYKCSACGEKAIIANWTPILSDFCPTCGAKMEEQE